VRLPRKQESEQEPWVHIQQVDLKQQQVQVLIVMIQAPILLTYIIQKLVMSIRIMTTTEAQHLAYAQTI